MNKIKPLILIYFLFISTINYGQHTDQINSNRPGETMSAFSVGKSVFQIESGIYGITEHHDILNYDRNGFGIDMTLRYGFLFEKLELIADLQYQNDTFNQNLSSTNQSAMKQTVVGAKYLLYDPFKNYKREINIRSWKANHAFDWHQLIPAVALFAGANFNFANNPFYFSQKSEISPKLMLITQNHFGDGSWVVVTNIIGDYIGTDFPSYGYGLTLTKGFNKKWSGFLENQGYKSDFYSDVIVRGGAAFLIDKNLQIDASISSSLKTTPSILYGGLGFSWRYDADYLPVKLKIDKGNAPKKSKKKTKKAKKNNIKTPSTKE